MATVYTKLQEKSMDPQRAAEEQQRRLVQFERWSVSVI